MKIEMGESLLQSYLKHVENCLISQTNWKTSSNWSIDESCREQVEFIYSKIKKNNQFSDVFKNNELDQILKQAEIDVLGINNQDTVFMVEVAFHEGGLNYGSKIETKNKIFEKLLRAYLIGLSYFPGKKYEIIFATPKTNPATRDIINDYFEILEREFASDAVRFKFITNNDFKQQILIPTIESTDSDADTGELFLRSFKLLNMFGMDMENNENIPAINQFIIPNGMIDKTTTSELNADNTVQLSTPPKIEFYVQGQIANKRVFNEVLLKIKRAKRICYYINGTSKEEIWNASNFNEDSNLMSNIKTSATFRKWKTKGIVKVELRID